MSVDWLAIRNDYINGGGSYRKMSEKYGVPLRTIAKHAKDEEWQNIKEENCNSIAIALQQKTAEAIVENEVSRISRLLAISDNLVDKIEQAVAELDMAQVTNKTKTKVIEYNNQERPDKPTRETIEEKKEILAIRSIIDRKGLQQIATALKAVWDMSAEDKGDATQKNNLLEAILDSEEIDTDDLSEVE